MTWSLTWAVAAVLVVATQCQLDPQDGQECFPQGDDGDFRVKEGDCTFFWKCQLREGLGRYMWTASKCVNGTVFNRKINRCEPPQSGEKCEGYVQAKLIPTGRDILPGCEDRFVCPADLQFFIYPDWNNCRNYYTCQQGAVTINNCQESFFNPLTFACTNTPELNNSCLNRYSVYTPPLNVKIAPRTIRPGCERVFQCPPDLQFFIYPDWNNCSNYNTCVQGTISPESCLTLGYPWYNPSTFACEQQIASNNVCFFRTP